MRRERRVRWRPVALALALGGLVGCTSEQQRQDEDARREQGRDVPGGADQPAVEPRPSLPEPGPPPEPAPVTIDSFSR